MQTATNSQVPLTREQVQRIVRALDQAGSLAEDHGYCSEYWRNLAREIEQATKEPQK